MANPKITIPAGFCQCGCGQKPKLAPCNVTRLGWTKGQPINYINGHNSRGETHPRWNDGHYVGKHGYVYVQRADHPNANNDGYVLEHILIIEKAMGKYFPKKAQGHHIDKNPSNNANNNLIACEDDAYHKLLHRRERALRECGHASWRRCNYCKQWDAPENLVIRPHPQAGTHHLMCSRKYATDRYWESKFNTP